MLQGPNPPWEQPTGTGGRIIPGEWELPGAGSNFLVPTHRRPLLPLQPSPSLAKTPGIPEDQGGGIEARGVQMC